MRTASYPSREIIAGLTDEILDLKKRIVELEAERRWIPVSEIDEVAYGEIYLVWYGDDESYGSERALDSKLSAPFSERVTHWMNLPQPPVDWTKLAGVIEKRHD